jgi:hypothetical protein
MSRPTFSTTPGGSRAWSLAGGRGDDGAARESPGSRLPLTPGQAEGTNGRAEVRRAIRPGLRGTVPGGRGGGAPRGPQ